MNIEARLERLEKQIQFYKGLVVVLAVVIVAGVSMGQAKSDIVDVLKCRKLEVYNPTGSIAAVISADDGGYLSIRNKEGKPAAVIAADDDGGHLGIYNKEGKGVILISAYDDSGHLSIRNKTGESIMFDGEGQTLESK